MNLGTLVENIIELKQQAKREGISMKKFGNLEILQKAGSRAVLSESIMLTLAKDEKGRYLILKGSYNTKEDEVARTNQGTKFM